MQAAGKASGPWPHSRDVGQEMRAAERGTCCWGRGGRLRTLTGKQKRVHAQAGREAVPSRQGQRTTRRRGSAGVWEEGSTMPVPAPSLCSSPRGTGLLGLMLPAWIPRPLWGQRAQSRSRAVPGEKLSSELAREGRAASKHQRSSTDSTSSGGAGLAMKQTQVQLLSEGKQGGPSLGDRMPSGGRAQKQLCPKTGLTASGRGAGTKQHPRGSTYTSISSPVPTPVTGGKWVSGGKYRFHGSTSYTTRLDR